MEDNKQSDPTHSMFINKLSEKNEIKESFKVNVKQYDFSNLDF